MKLLPAADIFLFAIKGRGRAEDPPLSKINRRRQLVYAKIDHNKEIKNESDQSKIPRDIQKNRNKRRSIIDRCNSSKRTR